MNFGKTGIYYCMQLRCNFILKADHFQIKTLGFSAKITY